MQSTKFLQGVLINQVRLLASELGRSPTAKEFDKDPRTKSTGSAIRCFGTWNGFLKNAGLPVINLGGRRYTKKELIDQVYMLEEELGRAPTNKEFTQDPRTASAPTITKYFGSWNQFLMAAGFRIRHHGRYNDEELITQIRVMAGELGRIPTEIEFARDKRTAVVRTIIDHFGSWDEYLKAAGLTRKFRPRRHRYSDNELLAQVRALAREMGRTPKLLEFSVDPRTASISAIINHFGSWNHFLKVARLPANKRSKKK